MTLRPFSVPLLSLVALVACGGSSDEEDAAPSCSSGSSVQVTTSGAAPSCLAVATGAAVSFMNTSGEAVTIRSDPHLTHGSCPELDALPTLAAGESVSVTMSAQAKTCGYHRHETGASLGRIQVGTGGAGTPGGDDPRY